MAHMSLVEITVYYFKHNNKPFFFQASTDLQLPIDSSQYDNIKLNYANMNVKLTCSYVSVLLQ